MGVTSQWNNETHVVLYVVLINRDQELEYC